MAYLHCFGPIGVGSCPPVVHQIRTTGQHWTTRTADVRTGIPRDFEQDCTRGHWADGAMQIPPFRTISNLAEPEPDHLECRTAAGRSPARSVSSARLSRRSARRSRSTLRTRRTETSSVRASRKSATSSSVACDCPREGYRFLLSSSAGMNPSSGPRGYRAIVVDASGKSALRSSY